jgi:3-hydroxy-9,10-secoandrosta-1,3,5(10)-triene-9,17-dione monooxygenase reductase component
VLGGSLAWIECRLDIVHDAGDHELVIGSVLDLGLAEGSPLLFYRGRFGGLST